MVCNMTEKTIHEQIKELHEIQERFRTTITALVANIKDNPAITQMKKEPKVFVMSSADVFGDQTMRLDPFYYDFSAQKTKLIELVDGANGPDQIVSLLSTIVKTGTYRTAQGTFSFHADVRSEIGKILKSL